MSAEREFSLLGGEQWDTTLYTAVKCYFQCLHAFLEGAAFRLKLVNRLLFSYVQFPLGKVGIFMAVVSIIGYTLSSLQTDL